MKHVLKATVLALSAWAMVSPASAAEPFRIAHVTGFSGPLAAYAKQLSVGMEMGFEYITKGTMEVEGRKIEIIDKDAQGDRSEEHTSELQSLMRISYAVFCLKKKKNDH